MLLGILMNKRPFGPSQIEPMTRKEYLLLGFAAVLFCGYVHFFTGWFKRPVISIRQAPPRLLAAMGGQGSYPAVFDLMAKYPLTSVKVVPWRDGKYNKFAPPVWSLQSKSNSVPTKGIIYGAPIPGMTSQKAPEPLKPGEMYHLVVESGRVRGELDFKPPAAPPPPAPAE
jgi:hypothetical protein